MDEWVGGWVNGWVCGWVYGWAMAFTDCCKQMECLGGMLLQSFLINGHFIYPCNAGYPS